MNRSAPIEEARQNERKIKRAGREIDRERKRLEFEEEQLVRQIEGARNDQERVMLEDQLNILRIRITDAYAGAAQMRNLEIRNRPVGANVEQFAENKISTFGGTTTVIVSSVAAVCLALLIVIGIKS